jgi:hypothetical protein
MFCSNCGVPQAQTGRFCASCGAASSGEIPAPAQTQPTPTMASQPAAASSIPQHLPSRGVPPGYAPPPGSPSAPTLVAPTAGVDNTLAWTLAFAPLLYVLLDGILLSAGADEAFVTVSLLVAVGVNCFLSWTDAKRLEKAGHDVSKALAVFLVPVYLFKRASILKQTLAIPVVWCLAFAASFAGAGLVGNTVGVALDVPAIEAEIRDGLQEQVGVSASVDCPSTVSPKPGSSFQCIVVGGGERAIVNVTVQNTGGDIVWQVQ